MQPLRKLTFQTFAESSILTSEIDPEPFRIDISQIGYFIILQQSMK